MSHDDNLSLQSLGRKRKKKTGIQNQVLPTLPGLPTFENTFTSTSESAIKPETAQLLVKSLNNEGIQPTEEQSSLFLPRRQILLSTDRQIIRKALTGNNISDQPTDSWLFLACSAFTIIMLIFTLYVFFNGGFPWNNIHETSGGVEILEYVSNDNKFIRSLKIPDGAMKQRKIWCSVGCDMDGFTLDHVKPSLCDYLVYSFFSPVNAEGQLYTCHDHNKESYLDLVEQFRNRNKTEVKFLEFGRIPPEYSSIYEDSCLISDCFGLPGVLETDGFAGAVLSIEYLSIPDDLHRDVIKLWRAFGAVMRYYNFLYAVHFFSKMEITDYKHMDDFLRDDKSLGIILSVHCMNEIEESFIITDAVCPQPVQVIPAHIKAISMNKTMNTIITTIGEDVWERHQQRIAVTITFKFSYCRLEDEKALICLFSSRRDLPYRTLCHDLVLVAKANVTYDPVTDCTIFRSGKQFASGILNTTANFWKQTTFGAYNLYLSDIEEDDQAGLCGETMLLDQFIGRFRSK